MFHNLVVAPIKEPKRCPSWEIFARFVTFSLVVLLQSQQLLDWVRNWYLSGCFMKEFRFRFHENPRVETVAFSWFKNQAK